MIDPAAADWAGIAAFKRAAAIYEERGYRTRLLAAAYRHHRHWSELIGGDISMTIPAAWQRLFNASSGGGQGPLGRSGPAGCTSSELLERVPEFRKAYEPDGLSIPEFDTYGAVMRTLRAFVASYWELVGTIDDLMIPNPDVKRLDRDAAQEESGLMSRTTVAQAIVAWLANQYVERDGEQGRFFDGVFGIFGHGNVAGMGEALEAAQDSVRYYQCPQ